MTRIVPARELSIDEIKELKNDNKPEVEVFVQGALCICYSGQCLMSSYIGGRSGNRGRCAGSCRLPYSVRKMTDTPVNTEGDYNLSMKDLCGLDSLPELIYAGVESFKIKKDGTLEFINWASINGMRGCYVATDYTDRYLFVAGYHDGKLTILSLNKDGSINKITDEIYHKGMGSAATVISGLISTAHE